MTYQEALEIIANTVQCNDYTEEKDIALSIVQKAIGKQMPKKPITETVNRGISVSGEYDIDFNYLCPNCNAVVGDYEINDAFY